MVKVVEALGAFSGIALGEKEKDGLESAEEAAKTLHSIRGKRQYELKLARSLALTKATYGWDRKGPPKAKSSKLDLGVAQVTKTSKASNPWLMK